MSEDSLRVSGLSPTAYGSITSSREYIRGTGGGDGRQKKLLSNQYLPLKGGFCSKLSAFLETSSSSGAEKTRPEISENVCTNECDQDNNGQVYGSALHRYDWLHKPFESLREWFDDFFRRLGRSPANAADGFTTFCQTGLIGLATILIGALSAHYFNRFFKS
ncbi:MAG: hypothetical protein SFT81_03090 [Candidatus Caenarcaniphilales bacterium]|nr:hypothetical protein [Candidatus Caenarcaniphilales bacterium]